MHAVDWRTNMKKILITLCMLLCLANGVWAGNRNTQFRSLVSSYKNKPGFEVVDLGGIALGLLRTAARASVDDEEDRQALKLFKGIKHLTVLDFSDADPELRQTFLRKALKILPAEEMLMETKDDDGETVRIYGIASDNGDRVKDIVILAGEALISLKGSIRTDMIGNMVNQSTR